MTSSLEINGKELQSIRTVTERSGYSRDYITKLAREGKIVASFINRQWFIDPASLDHYASSVALEQEARKERLSEERRRERRERELAEHAERLRKHVTESAARSKRGKSLKAPVTALGVLLIGIGVGATINHFSVPTKIADGQTAAGVSVVTSYGTHEVTMLDDHTIASLDLSQESVGLSTLEGANRGVLLLPSNEAGIEDPAEMFSDEVKVLTDEYGNRFVARVDAQGKVVEEIPFVVVPVTHEKTP